MKTIVRILRRAALGILTLALLLQPVTANAMTIYVDVDYDEFYGAPIAWASNNGIITEIANTFNPESDCTRGLIVEYLWHAAGSPDAPASSFTDVPAGSRYYKAVNWAVKEGITAGVGDGKFAPDTPVTRAEAVTFLWRDAGRPAGAPDGGFTDVPKDTWYAEPVNWAVANGITFGTGDNKFSPERTCTKGEIITFLFRSRNVEKDSAYIGNLKSGVFHKASCPAANLLKEGNKVYFSSRANAVSAGYIPCMVCNP